MCTAWLAPPLSLAIAAAFAPVFPFPAMLTSPPRGPTLDPANMVGGLTHLLVGQPEWVLLSAVFNAIRQRQDLRRFLVALLVQNVENKAGALLHKCQQDQRGVPTALAAAASEEDEDAAENHGLLDSAPSKNYLTVRLSSADSLSTLAVLSPPSAAVDIASHQLAADFFQSQDKAQAQKARHEDRTSQKTQTRPCRRILSTRSRRG